ncbi:Hypp7717 [Branchiostoma lanceolatum]|uniref:Hypp7717 protein n=1 Tax=Branchiostoma lanceolatum TaxID=7740 RepID=A0A8K0ECY1_BRALA|nr:Hypp7717 [Branchiostoma lanceolatum]
MAGGASDPQGGSYSPAHLTSSASFNRTYRISFPRTPTVRQSLSTSQHGVFSRSYCVSDVVGLLRGDGRIVNLPQTPARAQVRIPAWPSLNAHSRVKASIANSAPGPPQAAC